MSSIPKLNNCGSFDADAFNAVNPIVGITVYKNGVMIVHRKSKLQGKIENISNGRRDRQIKMFTPKSMARLVATINATDVCFKSMVTLTYPAIYPKEGRSVKTDLNRFLNLFRRKYETEYLWFLEFQKRGAPHFHILTEFDLITPRFRVDIAEAWVGGISKSNWIEEQAAEIALYKGGTCEYDIISQALSTSFKFTLRRETMELLRSKDGAKRYVTKYAVKEYQKEKPKDYVDVGRYWGCSENTKLSDGVYLEKTEDEIRQFLSTQEHACGDWDVLPTYLFNVDNV